MMKSAWQDPVWSKVIAASILAGIGFVVSHFFPDLMSSVVAFLAAVISLGEQTASIPIWLLAILVLIVTGTAVVNVVSLIRWLVPRDSNDVRPEWLAYTSDAFLGLRWRWDFLSDGRVNELHAFCPHCDFEVLPHRASPYAAVQRVAFHCDGCRSDLATFNEDYDSLESKVERLVQQKLRNGSWRERQREA